MHLYTAAARELGHGGRHVALVTVGVLLAPLGLHAQINFEEHVLSDGENGIRDAIVADVDGDGDNDVVSSEQSGGGILWYENDGGSPPIFVERQLATLSSGTLFAADLDGDGDTDVLAADRWYENDGGSPPAFTAHEWGLFFHPVHATDLDGDGDVDPVGNASSRLHWLESDGGTPPAFTEHEIPLTHTNLGVVKAVDLDADGDSDLLISLPGSAGEAGVAWLENDGQAPPAFTEHVIFLATNTGSIFATDMDGDGDLDVLVGGTFIAWFESDGGSPPSFVERSIDMVDGNSIHPADVDGDGDPDVLAAFPFDDPGLVWYENHIGTPPQCTVHVISDTFEDAHLDAGADIDGDGDADVLVSSDAFDPVVALAWFENHGAEIPCADVEMMLARCSDLATIQVRVTMTDTSHDGDAVTISVDGVPHVRPIVGAVASYREPGASIGLHDIVLEEPAGCVAPIVAECPAFPVGGTVTGMSGELIICLNETTGQSVQIPDAVFWDCEAAGLIVNPGDEVRQMVMGDVN